jgi:hypothetical protein
MARLPQHTTPTPARPPRVTSHVHMHLTNRPTLFAWLLIVSPKAFSNRPNFFTWFLIIRTLPSTIFHLALIVVAGGYHLFVCIFFIADDLLNYEPTPHFLASFSIWAQSPILQKSKDKFVTWAPFDIDWVGRSNFWFWQINIMSEFILEQCHL